jgi:hypothetical protein
MPIATILGAISPISSLVVGCIFLVTGVVKALAPKTFIIHISRLQLFPGKASLAAAYPFTVVECVLGVALILRLFPLWLFPGTIVLLFALSGLTYWSTATKRTEDCGCYGGLIDVSPTQSLLLNAFYIALMGLAWFIEVPDFLTLKQQVIAVIVSLAVSCLVTAGCYLYFWKYEKPILNLDPLKVNRRWQAKWLEEYTFDLMTGDKLVVFLLPGCPMCSNWIKVLRVVQSRADLPEVVAGVAQTPEQVRDFVALNKLNFPVVGMKPSVMNRLVEAFPTAVVLEDGVIKEKWVGAMPIDFVKRIKPNLVVSSEVKS